MAYARGICVFGLVILAVLVISGVEGHKKKMEFKCLGEQVQFPESEKTVMKECIDEMKAAKGDEEEKSSEEKEEDHKKKWAAMRCVKACKLRKQGILVNDNPEFNFDKLDETIDAMIPEAARAGIKADSRKCYEDVSEPLTNDDNCKNHETYQKCVMKAFFKNCKKDGEDETM